jgi:hypothetical protein
MKAKMAEKGFNWKTSWKARCCVAVLDFNDEGWKLQASADNGFEELDERLLAQAEQEELQRRRRNEARREEEVQKAERIRRGVAKQERKARTTAAARQKQLAHVDPHVYELDSNDENESDGT